jgi:hypothetical protein
MQRFKNGFFTKLTADLSASAYQIPLDNAAKGKLTFPDRENDFYIVTLSDSLDVTKQTAVEVVSVADGFFINRAQEGTSARSWPAGTFAYLSVTAAWLEQVGAGGASSGGAGTTYPDTGQYQPGPTLTLDDASSYVECQTRQALTVNFAQFTGMSAFEVLLILENASSTAQTVTFNAPPDVLDTYVVFVPRIGTPTNGDYIGSKWAVQIPPGYNVFRIVRQFARITVLPVLAS